MIVSALVLAAVFVTFQWGIMKDIPADSEQVAHVVVIDPGHGGFDPGKVGHNGERESDINLALAFKLKEALEARGYAVLMTRDDDYGLYGDNAVNKKAEDMRARCGLIAESGAEIVVSIHQNSYSDTSVHGAQVFYYTHSEGGKKLASHIQNSIRDNADEYNRRSIKTNNSYYMLVHTPCPTVIVECGFLSNYEETAKLLTEEYQSILAESIAMGVDSYFAK